MPVRRNVDVLHFLERLFEGVLQKVIEVIERVSDQLGGGIYVPVRTDLRGCGQKRFDGNAYSIIPSRTTAQLPTLNYCHPGLRAIGRQTDYGRFLQI